MVPKTCLLRISLFTSALFFNIFRASSQVNHICDVEYSFGEYKPRTKCVSSAFHSKTTYSCVTESCTDPVLENCYAVLRGIGGYKPDLDNPVSPSPIVNYRKIERSPYIEGYRRVMPPGGVGSSPAAICYNPSRYAHCTSCTTHR
ncbi:hypothetical protein O181_019017 [Austropuccinia psidii MF-1]|uniref:Secreted protein n=1 Tax=Austropuccinia psidii MF-1 TaxID=1389203 RepID=A0A9Q3C8X6_9BASI|nr:hypothetical protein [Austropuccinia psidii MF-1]